MNNILIASITPYFLEKQVSWFEENLQTILDSTKTQSFFQDNVVFLKTRGSQNMSELLRKLDEMGYERVFDVESPGEFSQKGGVIDIFPINLLHAVRLDFLGNTLERISVLDIKIEDEEKSRQLLQKKLKSQKLFSDLKNLKIGDYLVHLDHGVAKYVGTEKMGEENYYVLEYAKQDKLFVPVGLERKLSRYVGFADPTVSRLGSELWQRTKRHIKEGVEKLAKELLALYAQKEVATRKPYEPDAEIEAQIKAGFAYEETPDQLQALEDIKKDLAGEKPMDRIVCGDVGFGKTEIALRSAALAAANGYQCAIICPTTILAKQHFDNFTTRLADLPLHVAMLSRLQSTAEQKKVIKEIGEGKIDIAIGTHRLLSKDIVFKNLQLLIIDDEQRFGVKQKEVLRQKHPALDLLSLSATPIPRTMYLALSSFKNISLMQTAPVGRSSIETSILPYSKNIIKEAIAFELERGGQIYFLHNRVQTMATTVKNLEKIIYDKKRTFAKHHIVNISAIHGRMPEAQLIKTMEEFKKGTAQVLVATTIIENGIDLPNVNTIIIEDASRLGLSQAYQIRGRVGRSFKKGYAYLFYPKHMTDVARERLEALGQANELGAGYQIALRDMEIRGAGNILGREQSGSINKIGLNLYCQMLAESVEKLRQ